MKHYGVKAVAKLSGVSVRTLHYYDKIGLLKPTNRTEAGYRYYGEDELLRLQQILFYKELDFPLKEIHELLDDEAFDLVDALESHKLALKARQKRLKSLLLTIDNTINKLKKGEIMSNPEELYEGLPQEYREEAINEYGKEEIERSEKALMKLGKEGFKKLKAEMDKVNDELFGLKNEDPQSDGVQAIIARHYQVIRQFWGTSNLEDKQAEAYAGLGTLYVQDERFTKRDGETHPDFAVFLEKAMGHFAETNLK